MSGPRTNAALYAAPADEFLATSEEEVYAPLATPHGYTLAPEQQSAWRPQLSVLRAALEDQVAPPPKAPAPWIHLEFDIPRLGRRVDAVLVTPSCVIPIEFEVIAKKFERFDYEQAWDYGLDPKNFLTPSHAAPICPILCAKEASDSDRRWKPPDAAGVLPLFCCNGESLGRAIRLALESAAALAPPLFAALALLDVVAISRWVCNSLFALRASLYTKSVLRIVHFVFEVTGTILPGSLAFGSRSLSRRPLSVALIAA